MFESRRRETLGCKQEEHDHLAAWPKRPETLHYSVTASSWSPAKSSADNCLQTGKAILQQSQRPEGGMSSVPDHDMVVQLNLKSTGGCFQFARRLYVLPRRFGIAGRMIVHNDER